MSDGPGDLLRSPDEVMLPDGRTHAFVMVDQNTGQLRQRALDDFHRHLASCELHEKVPEDVRINFETARNLYLYSFFVYRFTVVSSLQAYTTLEFALRTKAKLAGVPKCIGWKNKVVKITMRDYLYIAVKRGWIEDSIFEGVVGNLKPGNSYCKRLIEIVPYLRNNLSHGSTTLYPQGEALGDLLRVSRIINKLFA